MKLLLAHENPDLDAIASLALARRLHPDGRPVVVGSAVAGAAGALALVRDALRFETLDELEEGVRPDRVVVVDTHDRGRLGRAAGLVDGAELEVWDHHPDGDLSGLPGVVRAWGACASLLALRLRDLGIEPTPLEATVGLAGIMADTLNLSSSLTTPGDFEAAAWLAAAGADLGRARELRDQPLAQPARDLLARVLAGGRVVPVGGRPVLVHAESPPERVPAADAADEALGIGTSDAVILALGRPNTKSTDVIGRARANAFDLGTAMRELGGGGHPGAASARLDLPPEAALERALAAVAGTARPVATVSEAMTRTVRTLDAGASVDDAAAALARHGHGGAPVLEGERLAGIVSRRDLERALRHGLANAPVSSVMTREVVTATPDEPLESAEAKMSGRGVGRVPVLDGERLAGIVTRSDLLARLRPAREPEGGAAERVLAALDDAARELLARVLRDHLPSGSRLSLVGGAVRDALLGRPALDLDLVVEGASAADVGRRLAEATGAALHRKGPYDNASLRLPGERELDLVGARDEWYPGPGAPPAVAPGTLAQDLARRDFSLNAIAVTLALRPDGVLAGRLVDPHGGLVDLRAGLLRALHPLSFLEDPSRIVRGARLAARLGLELHRATRASIPDALLEAAGLRRNHRVRDELRLVLEEPRPGRVLERLREWDALGALLGTEPDLRPPGTEPDLRPVGTEPDLRPVARLDARREAGEAVGPGAYAVALLAVSGPAAAERFGWPRRLAVSLERVLGAAAEPAGAPGLGEDELAALLALRPDLEAALRAARARPPRRLAGSDVLALGLPAGPRVGRVLREVEAARRDGRVRGFDEELELASVLVRADDLAPPSPEPTTPR